MSCSIRSNYIVRRWFWQLKWWTQMPINHFLSFVLSLEFEMQLTLIGKLLLFSQHLNVVISCVSNLTKTSFSSEDDQCIFDVKQIGIWQNPIWFLALVFVLIEAYKLKTFLDTNNYGNLFFSPAKMSNTSHKLNYKFQAFSQNYYRLDRLYFIIPIKWKWVTFQSIHTIDLKVSKWDT